MNKWTNTRDAFMRSLKTKSGQAAKRKYVYHDHLLFLLVLQEPSETQSSSMLVLDEDNEMPNETQEGKSVDENIAMDDEIDDLPPPPPPKKQKKQCRSGKELETIEQEILKELQKTRSEVPKCTFFASFEEYVMDMSEAEKLELHMQILKSISDIKAKRTQNVYFYED